MTTESIDKLAYYRMIQQRENQPEVEPVATQTYSEHHTLIQNNNKQEKYQQKYLQLKRGIEAIREAQAQSSDASCAASAVSYWEITIQQVENKVKALEKRIEAYCGKLDREIEETVAQLTKKKEEFTTRLSDEMNLHKNTIVTLTSKLNVAKERQKNLSKTKEQIRMEKELQQVILDFKKTNPDKNLEYYMPGVQALLSDILPPPTQNTTHTPPPPTIPPPPPEEQEEENLTPWQLYLKMNPTESTQQAYHNAIAMGIKPEIPEPGLTYGKRKPAKSSSQTITREALAKVLPNYKD